jgi:catalase
MATFDRERIVHAGGGGAHGYFQVTGDVSHWTRAAFLGSVGRRTPVFVRFSSPAGCLGSADPGRDPRGFAIRFYTEDGNYDLVGNNTPVFFIRDPERFSDFVRSQRRRPDSDLRDHDAQWDFWTRNPASAHQVTLLMTDRGTPRSWRTMNGYGCHTFLWVNRGGERSWVKYTLRSDQGVRNLTDAEAAAMCAEDPDQHARDLRTSIDGGDRPSWTLHVQVMGFEDAPGYRFNPFDVTKVWPHGDHPLVEVGRLVLDRNPESAAEVEQAAFDPANMVPGIGPSPDPMLQGRLFSYPDTHRYRIGPNYLRLPINRPIGDTGHLAELAYEIGDEMVRAASAPHRDDDDLVQPRALWERVLSPVEREHLVGNIAAHASAGVTPEVLGRVVEYWTAVHPELGAGVARALRLEQVPAAG